MSCILKKGNFLIGNVEEDHCCSKDTACTDDLHIENVRNSHKQENQYLSADTLESDCTGQLLICNRTHHSGDVVNDHKCKKCQDKAVTAT